MNVLEALNARFSCRAFKAQPLDRAIVLKILTAALRTPSWANTQPWEIYVASGEALGRLRAAHLAAAGEGRFGKLDVPAPEAWPSEIQARMQASLAQRFKKMGLDRQDETARKAAMERAARFFDAPVVVWLCLDRGLSPWSLYDLGALSQSIMLAAQDLGVASIPAAMLARQPELIRAELGIPEHLSVAIGIALGYPELENPQNQIRSDRRPLEEAVRLKGF